MEGFVKVQLSPEHKAELAKIVKLEGQEYWQALRAFLLRILPTYGMFGDRQPGISGDGHLMFYVKSEYVEVVEL